MVGREKERELLNKALQDNSSHFIAVYGRRRIGKTFLVRETFDYRFTFQHAGSATGSMKEQLFAFDASLKDAGMVPMKSSSNWPEAFENLKDLIRASSEKKKVIFIDELSWMDTPKSGLVSSLENFWNGWASARKDILLIISASATSWMLSKVIHNKGGLYNRLTEKIHLTEFNLSECEDYVREQGLILTRTQIAEYYMIFGGVPYYWTFLQKGLSLPQNIDMILFSDDAPLKDEFKYLYASIFRHPGDYIKLVRALSAKKAGLTRDELISVTGIVNSGALTSKLEELESCGFIRTYKAFGMKKKNRVYQLIDAFTLFYYHFLEKKPTDEHFWMNQVNTPAVNTWAGFAFERVCLQHTEQIKISLGISGILTEENAWQCRKDPNKGVFGSQIDLLIVRRDQVINLCEMKYTETEYTLNEKGCRSIRNKINDLRTVTGTRYAVFPTLITTYGLIQNSYSGEIQSVITLEDLFQKGWKR